MISHRIYGRVLWGTGALFLVLLLSAQIALSQTMIGIGTRFNDTFREWIVTTDDEDTKGSLQMTWSFRDDWTEWDVRVGDVFATIRQKWKDDPNLWEIRADGRTVNARTAWPNEFTRWKLTDGTHSFNWRTPYANQREEWSTEGSRDGSFFQIYTYWEGDPREWVIVDELGQEVSFALKVAMVFLALHYSTPRI